MILKDRKGYLPWNIFKSKMVELLKVADEMNPDIIQNHLKNLLPTYKPRNLYPTSSISNTTNFPIKGEA